MTPEVSKPNKVTVLLSTYNGSKFLQQQLNSLYEQTYPNIRILVRDDGSSDSTRSILENEKLSTLTPLQANAFNSLCKKTNVLFTPHIAGWTFESHIKINVALVQKITALTLV